MTTPTPSEPRRPVPTRAVLAALVVVGLALLAAAVWSGTRPVSYGWFAYAPLSETTYVPNPGLAPGTTALLAGLGALLLGGAAGFVVGRRSLSAPGPATGNGETPAG
ncbi:hypothetical protein GCM10010413_23170 [Promicromonospora sukumoe]|uniref:Heme/copper-type cytochrome/quinol oxidase subunit 1 n=1 Tax=Promicromonospora sukumoe TaxID=88382 RepID=A0A7W3PE75_9MICO|nr:hypothetical protein [Promicromonospora sukumoe]MBA8808466.1 heme/copper-type cytochrome/quinol oxidase subunit 1 [Promicromonospora sukumoe]